ncbi:DNA-binding MarR family transcriptional regulator [Brevundimonas vesicularis]|uniref:MarR family winged helix-turn-helix transcriptional regulator n=1 Tax=Brevundimonas vesicularis TaxID=41276 RepID=UPI0027838B6F|nr:helix-turn-helix domain-containing protein [Brevundimonas vesicularis]MDQ1191867.1 DNA-binding MarR family transcriptional regulator [Brevundimonas vesicularis]
MQSTSPTLGTLLRHLVDLLDGEVEAAYEAADLAWRPRYTPVLRVLMKRGGQSIKAIAQEVGISHSAVSQTVTQMVKDDLVTLKPGADARERIVLLTDKTQQMIPRLERQWAAVNLAADTLDRELSAPLTGVVREAIAALTEEPFGQRIQAAAKTQSAP